MKNSLRLLVPAALLVAGVAQAAPFTGKGIPTDAGAIVHIDAQAAGNSSIFTSLKELGEQAGTKNEEQRKAFKAVMDELGLDEKAVTDATLAIYAPAAGSKDPVVSGLINGKFDRSKFLAIPKKHPEVKANKLGAHTWFSVADLDKAFGGTGGAKSGKTPTGCLCPVNDSTVVVATDETMLAKSLKAIDAKSVYSNTAAKAAFTGSPMFAGYIPESFIAAARGPKAPAAPGAKPEPEMKSLVFSLAEASGNLNLNANAKMDSEQSAKQVHAQVSMFQGMAPMMFGQENPDDTAQQKADKAFLMSLVSAVKFSAAGDSFTVNFAYPAEKLAAKLKEKKADIAALAAQQTGGDSAPARPVAKRPRKAKPAPVTAAE